MNTRINRLANALIGIIMLSLVAPWTAFAAPPTITPDFSVPGIEFFTTTLGALFAFLILACVGIFAISVVQIITRLKSNSRDGIMGPLIGVVGGAVASVILIGGSLFFNRVIAYYS